MQEVMLKTLLYSIDLVIITLPSTDVKQFLFKQTIFIL